jgi:hypothetical protein
VGHLIPPGGKHYFETSVRMENYSAGDPTEFNSSGYQISGTAESDSAGLRTR